MWIIKDSSDKVVYLLDQEPIFKNGILDQPLKALDIKEDQVIVEQADKPDLPFAGNYFSYSNGVWSVIDQSVYDEDVYQPLFEAKKAETITKMKILCNDNLSSLAADYPEREAQTWPVQLEEAKAYLADNSAPTPFIKAALNEGETVEQYANLIVSNNAAWSNYAGSVIKMRRTFEQRINAATTIEELESISKEISNA